MNLLAAIEILPQTGSYLLAGAVVATAALAVATVFWAGRGLRIGVWSLLAAELLLGGGAWASGAQPVSARGVVERTEARLRTEIAAVREETEEIYTRNRAQALNNYDRETKVVAEKAWVSVREQECTNVMANTERARQELQALQDGEADFRRMVEAEVEKAKLRREQWKVEEAKRQKARDEEMARQTREAEQEAIDALKKAQRQKARGGKPAPPPPVKYPEF